MKQRRHLSYKITAVFAASIMSIALTGITCGSFAWFTYMTRAKIEEFRGVTIGFGDLQAGIVSEVELPDAEQYGLIRDDSRPDQTIYWVDGHTIESETLCYVLETSGYAKDTLVPTTTRKYSNGDPFELFSSPTLISNGENADKTHYVHIPLVFRYEDILEEGTYISNENIYLSQVKLSALSTNSFIHKSIRIYTDNLQGVHHLINPSSNNDGTTDVGGVLDLNGDGFYDLDYLPNDKPFEHIYGQVQEFEYNEHAETDITPPPSDRSTFNAGHMSDTYTLASCTPEVAEYEGFYGFRNKRKPVATTNPLTDNLAYLDLTMFIEGWDTHVIDSEIDVPFNVEMKFEVVL